MEMEMEGKGREGKGRERKGRQHKGREGMGRESMGSESKGKHPREGPATRNKNRTLTLATHHLLSSNNICSKK